MINEQKNRAIRTLEKLRDNLQAYVDKDPEQDVTGIAISAVDAVVADARQYVDEDDPVLASIAEVISPATIEEGDDIRCADLLLVVNVLLGRIGPPDRPSPRVVRSDPLKGRR